MTKEVITQTEQSRCCCESALLQRHLYSYPQAFSESFLTVAAVWIICGRAMIEFFKRIQNNGIKKVKKLPVLHCLLTSDLTIHLKFIFFFFSVRMKSLFWVSDLCLWLKSGFQISRLGCFHTFWQKCNF